MEEAVVAIALEDPAYGQARACNELKQRGIPWFESQDVKLLRVLTDRGTAYCGKVEDHAYQLYLAVEDIDHTKTKVRHPQTNGMCERFPRTIKDEFYDIILRHKVDYVVIRRNAFCERAG